MTFKTLELLAQSNLYSSKNRKRVSEHPSPYLILGSLRLLQLNQLLSQETFDVISMHPNPPKLANAIIKLKQNIMLNSADLELMSQSYEPDIVINIWLILDSMDLLTAENKTIISGHFSPTNLLSGLSTLNTYGILNKSTLDLVLQHPYPKQLGLAFMNLKLMDRLTPHIQNHFATQTRPEILSLLINYLHQSHIFIPHHLTLLDNHPQIQNIYIVCNQLEQAGVRIHQQLFDLILTHANQLEHLIEILGLLTSTKMVIPNYFYFIQNNLGQDYIKDLALLMMSLHKNKMLTQDNFLKLVDINPDLKTVLYEEMLCLATFSMLDQENFEFLHQHTAPHLASALAYLRHEGILNEEYRAIIKTQEHTRLAFSILYYLSVNDILTTTNELIAGSSWSQLHIAMTLRILHNSHQLNLENVTTLISNLRESPSLSLIKVQLILLQNSILSSELLSFIKKCNYPYELAKILCLLHQNELLSPDNIAKLNKFVTKEDFYDCRKTLAYLHQESILTQTNFDLIIQSQSLSFLKIASDYLWKLSYLNQDHFDVLTTVNEQGDILIKIFNILDSAKKLNKWTMMALMETSHQALLSPEVLTTFWHLIPTPKLSDENLYQIFIASKQPKPLLAIQQLKLTDSPSFSPLKESLLSSTQALSTSYGDSMSIKQQIMDINFWLYQRSDTPKLQAAKRWMQLNTKCIAPQNHTLSLFILVYHALHDARKCTISATEAGDVLVDLLYECQRAFNLNDEGVDLGGNDLALGADAACKKILEKLNGIHADVVLDYSTPEIMVKDQALAYLQSVSSPRTAADYQSTKILFAKLENNKTLEPIWDRLVASLTSLQTLDGKSIPCPNLDSLERNLLCSPGYRAYVASEQAQIEISHFSLFLGDEPTRVESDRPLKRPYFE